MAGAGHLNGEESGEPSEGEPPAGDVAPQSAGYRVEFMPDAQRQIQKLDNSIAMRLKPVIMALGAEPHPSGCTQMVGDSDYWRVRNGAYRVIYTVDEEARVVLIVAVGHRSKVFWKFDGGG